MGKPKQIQKSDLVLAAKKQLLQHGQANVTLKSVAESVGVTQGVVYYHFRTKQQLLLALIEQYEEDLQRNYAGKDLRSIVGEEMYKTQTKSDEQNLLTELIAISSHQKELKQKLSVVLRKKLQLFDQMLNQDSHKARMFAAILDGLALQSRLDPNFPIKEMYQLAELTIKNLLDSEAIE